MGNEERFDVPFVAEMALREKQIQQNYRPIIAVHKWFARRPGTLFRSLVLAEFVDAPLDQSYFHANDLVGVRIADPFMGGRNAGDRGKIGQAAMCGDWISIRCRRG